jgi:phosphotransacetylase/acyl dehydratase
MNPYSIQNHTFDEIRIGETASLTRTLTAQVVRMIAAASDGVDPALLDPSLARKLGNGTGAHSIWIGALVPGLLCNELPGPGTVCVGQNLRFVHTLAVGDSATVTIRVREKHSDGRTIVFDCECVNQRGEPVMKGTAEVLAPFEKLVMPRPEGGQVFVHTHDKFARFIERCAAMPNVPVAVAHPCDASSLGAAIEAKREDLIDPILVGPSAKIRDVAEKNAYDISGLRLEDAPHSHAAAARAVELVRQGVAQALMKGSLHTDELMGEVVRADTGLRTERRLSHAFLLDVPTYHKPLLVTDAAINIVPDLMEKRDICQNAIDLAHILGIERPKVAILSAVETINPKMPSTTDAASLCMMARRGQITGAVLDGPLALDNAISREAAAIKKIESEVAGDADILLVPDLEAGNILAKQLTFLTRSDAAGIVLGARVPIVLTSRADNLRTKLASCAVCVLMVCARQGLVGVKAG